MSASQLAFGAALAALLSTAAAAQSPIPGTESVPGTLGYPVGLESTRNTFAGGPLGTLAHPLAVIGAVMRSADGAPVGTIADIESDGSGAAELVMVALDNGTTVALRANDVTFDSRTGIATSTMSRADLRRLAAPNAAGGKRL